MALIVAIDPGVNGGIVWSTDGAVQCAKMPASDVEVCQLLADLSCKAKDVSLYLEEPPLFAGKTQADAAAALGTTVCSLRKWIEITGTTWTNLKVRGPYKRNNHA